MYDSCFVGMLDRRSFLAASGALSMLGLTQTSLFAASDGSPVMAPIEKKPARVKAVFLYPPADVVNAGENEDQWAPHNWFTWPGNQFQPEQQEATFAGKIKDMVQRIGLTVTFAPKAIYQQAAIDQFIAETKAADFDAVLVINFWNTFADRSYQIAMEAAPTAIVYQPIGSSHQLPSEKLRQAERLFFIHSIENWDEIERGLRAVHTKSRLAQSRMLRISDRPKRRFTEQSFGIDTVSIEADEFNATFDAIKPDNAIIKQAMKYKTQAAHVIDVTDKYFVEALRSHLAVGQMLQRYGADAITIKCLMLKHRKPCLSFAINNGNLIPCGCENDFNATTTLMLGNQLFERGGFQHNPDFDTSRNQYFGSHCTCAMNLKGPQAPHQEYTARPFFHQLPKTLALDVQWTPDDPVALIKYNSEKNSLACWTGKVVGSPTCPSTGGCATRVLVDIDEINDVCDIYPGPHPILYCADRGMARRIRVIAQMYGLDYTGNV